MDQNQQDDAPPASNSTAIFNNDRSNKQVERRQTAHVPDAKKIGQNLQDDSPPASNSTVVCNNARSNNQLERRQIVHVPDTNQKRLPIPVVKQTVPQNLRHITSTPSTNVQYGQIQPSGTSLLGKRISNIQRQPSSRVPFQPYNLPESSNCHVYHNTTTSPIFINTGINPSHVYKLQARGTPENRTLARYQGFRANNCNATSENRVKFLNNSMQSNRPIIISNIAIRNCLNENNVSRSISMIEPHGQYNSNSCSRFKNIGQNINNEVDQALNLSTKTPEIPRVSYETLNTLRPTTIPKIKTIAKKFEEIPKEPLKGVLLPSNKSISPTATNTEDSSEIQLKRRRNQGSSNVTASQDTNLLSENINTGIDTNNLDSNQIPKSSLQSNLNTSLNVNKSSIDTIILEQNEPLNQTPVKRKIPQTKHKDNEAKRKTHKNSPKIKESSSIPTTKKKLDSGVNTISNNENSQDSSGISNDGNVAAIPNTPEDIKTNNLKPDDAEPLNENTLVATNSPCEIKTFQGEYLAFLRSRNYNV